MEFRGVLSKLQRVTTPGRRLIPEVDGLRFVAIAMVVLYHLDGYVSVKSPVRSPGWARGAVYRLLSHGNHGVEVFFVISGFILGLPFARAMVSDGPRPDAKRYYLRRLTRLEPPYLLTLVVFSLVSQYIHPQAASIAIGHAVASALYQHWWIFGGMNPANCVMWSLEVEIQFYLLAPLLASFLFSINSERRRAVTLFAAVGVAAGLSAALPQESFWHESILGYAQFFLVGMLLAERRASSVKEVEKTIVWDVVGLAAWIGMEFIWDRAPWISFGFPLLMIPAFVAASRGRFMNALLGSPIVSTVGGMCYSIYLLHFATISALGRFTRFLCFGTDFAWNFGIQAALLVPAVLCVATVFFVLVERPCMRQDWPSRLLAWFRARSLTPSIGSSGD